MKENDEIKDIISFVWNECCDGKNKSRGCKELCKKCDNPWGTPTDHCYEKPHNIVNFDEQKSRRIYRGGDMQHSKK